MPTKSSVMAGTHNQTAMYWSTPSSDGYGGYTFANPVELDCRWEDRVEKFIGPSGEDEISSSVVFLEQDVVLGGYLFLGDENDLDSAAISPYDVDGAKEIRSFRKTPDKKVSKYERVAYLR